MLKNISPLICPELLKTLAEMGHGDEIIFADAHFPAYSLNSRVIRADGLTVSALLCAVIPLIELDSYASPLVMMAAAVGDVLDPTVEQRYRQALFDGLSSSIEAVTEKAAMPEIIRIDRFAFYQRSREAFAIVLTGELAKYGNILLKKGVILLSD